VRIALGASPTLALLLLLAHGGALMVIAIVTLPFWAKTLAVAVIVASGAWTIQHALMPMVLELEVGEGGQASLRERDGSWHDARVVGSSFVAPWLTVVNLRLAGLRHTRHVVILPDSVALEDFRRLRVLLRWAPPRPRNPASSPNSRD
jgi:toxin CptA